MAGGEGVEINVLNHGVEVKQMAKDWQIFLSKKAWLTLRDCRTQLNEAIRSEKEIQQMLDEGRDIRVHTNLYSNKMYVHIRS